MFSSTFMIVIAISGVVQAQLAPRTFVPTPLNPYNNPYYSPPGVAPGVNVPILSYSSEHSGDGSYGYSYTSADGKQVEESGYLKDAFINNNGEPEGIQVVQGRYAYTAPDGTPIEVTYVADENGFRPTGIHIPANGRSQGPISSLGPNFIPTVKNANNRGAPFNRFNAITPGFDRTPITPFNRIDPYNRGYSAGNPYTTRANPYPTPYSYNQANQRTT